MKIKMLVAAAAMAVTSVATVSPAQAENLSFNIINDSNYIISSFQVNEGRGWGRNALSREIRGGAQTKISFLKDGPCKIMVRVGWRTTDGGQEISDPWKIDICEATNVYFDGNKVTYD